MRKLQCLVIILMFCGPSFCMESKVILSDLKQELVFHGQLDARQKTNVHAPSLENAYWSLTADFVKKEGSFVNKGDLIISFDKLDASAEVRQKREEEELARSQLELTRYELENEKSQLEMNLERRKLNLQKAQTYLLEDEQNLLPKIEKEKARLEAIAAELELKQAKKALSQFQERAKVSLKVKEQEHARKKEDLSKQERNFKSLDILAPETGVVYYPLLNLKYTKDRLERGKSVNGGNKIAEIVSFKSFKAVVYAVQSDAISISAGDNVEVRVVSKPGEKIQGKVVSIAQFPQTRKERLGDSGPGGGLKEVAVEIELAQSHAWMRPGMSVQARVSSLLDKSKMVLPLAALSPDSRSVQVKKSGKLISKTVKVGKSSLTHFVVEEGVAQGDLVQVPYKQ